MAQILPPLKPIPIKDRLSVLYVEKGHLDVRDGAFVVVDKTGVRTHTFSVPRIRADVARRLPHPMPPFTTWSGSLVREIV